MEDIVGTDDPYNLFGSVEGVNWVEIGYGEGDEYFDLSGKLSWVRYLRIEPAGTHVEIDGIVAENLGASSPVVVTMTPDDDDIVIPSEGGSFGFTAEVANVSGDPQTVQAWIIAVLPNGKEFGPVLGPATLTHPPGAVRSFHLVQHVPGGLPQVISCTPVWWEPIRAQFSMWMDSVSSSSST